MQAYERLLQYVQVYTTSDELSDTVPSTDRQFALARLLAAEMKELGITDARVDDKCYVYGTIPATPGYEDKVRLGFIAHLDTAPDCSGENVHPLVWKDYDGGELVLKNGRVLSPEVFADLKDLKGKTLITSDGTTLLGADDKAGIAEIMTMAERLIKSGAPHGQISLGFSPDEEIGGGAADLDLAAFGADYGYTVDGGAENEIEFENFNAAAAKFEITGRSVHPGDAKNKMVNAALVAMQINRMLPEAEIPAGTEGREGFYHVTDIRGDVEQAVISYIVRDHDEGSFEARKQTLRLIEKRLNEQYGEGTVRLAIREQYRNMIEKIRPCMHLIDTAAQVMRALGMEPKTPPVRGGTDGAQLSFRGLPCPNLGTGGYAFHGPYEHISAEGMELAVQVLMGIAARYADRDRERRESDAGSGKE